MEDNEGRRGLSLSAIEDTEDVANIWKELCGVLNVSAVVGTEDIVGSGVGDAVSLTDGEAPRELTEVPISVERMMFVSKGVEANNVGLTPEVNVSISNVGVGVNISEKDASTVRGSDKVGLGSIVEVDKVSPIPWLEITEEGRTSIVCLLVADTDCVAETGVVNCRRSELVALTSVMEGLTIVVNIKEETEGAFVVGWMTKLVSVRAVAVAVGSISEPSARSKLEGTTLLVATISPGESVMVTDSTDREDSTTVPATLGSTTVLIVEDTDSSEKGVIGCSDIDDDNIGAAKLKLMLLTLSGVTEAATKVVVDS